MVASYLPEDCMLTMCSSSSCKIKENHAGLMVFISKTERGIPRLFLLLSESYKSVSRLRAPGKTTPTSIFHTDSQQARTFLCSSAGTRPNIWGGGFLKPRRLLKADNASRSIRPQERFMVSFARLSMTPQSPTCGSWPVSVPGLCMLENLTYLGRVFFKRHLSLLEKRLEVYQEVLDMKFKPASR